MNRVTFVRCVINKWENSRTLGHQGVGKGNGIETWREVARMYKVSCRQLIVRIY